MAKRRLVTRYEFAKKYGLPEPIVLYYMTWHCQGLEPALVIGRREFFDERELYECLREALKRHSRKYRDHLEAWHEAEGGRA